jgi:hypothetical protein
MSTRKPSPQNRALRPAPEDLEDRQMLSATVSGTDIDGDMWTLRLIGPGSLAVTKQNGPDGMPLPLTTPSEINQITIGGAEPLVTRLIGKITKVGSGPNAGKVFFQTLKELPSTSERITTGGQSLLSIVMPNFWLGFTTQVTPSTTFPSVPSPPSISIPDGVNTLKFGGVDVRHDIPILPPTTTPPDVSPTVTLGLPLYGGTTIIIDQSISRAQQVTPPPSLTTPTPITIQQAVEFSVSGRLSLFQANSIVDATNTNTPPQFPNSTGGSTIGGTVVVSGTSGTAPFLVNGQLRGGLTGQIGNLRIGDDATNLTALAFDTTTTGGAKISNFSIGGEATNVQVIAPNGLRNAVFGQGMDNTEILAHVINTLAVNQVARNSTVVSDRTISRATFGGDVDNTNVLSGYAQNFSTIISTIEGTPATATAPATAPAPPPTPGSTPTDSNQPVTAQTGGGMVVHVVGNVNNSVFAASVQPLSVPPLTLPPTPTSPTTVTFGRPQVVPGGVPGVVDLPTGHIKAKVEGNINNNVNGATVDNVKTVDQSGLAFYAQVVHRNKHHVTVVPPHIPKPQPNQPVHAPGLNNPFRLFPFTASPKDVSIPSSSRTADPATTTGTPTPRGPLAHATAPRTKAKTKTS